MSYAITELNIPVLVVDDGTDYTFENDFMRNEIWTPQNPARLRMMNESSYDLRITMKTSGDSFFLRAGDCITFALAPNEIGFFIVNKFIHTTVENAALLLITYFSNREEVMQLENSVDYSDGSSSDYPAGANVFSSSSGNKANATATATLSGAVGKTTYVSGFEVTGSGATTALVVIVTMTGINGGTQSYIYSAVAGVLVENTPLIVEFSKPLPASATNTAISVSCPALGAGSTNNVVNIHGYQL
jgi:hypothetical protein